MTREDIDAEIHPHAVEIRLDYPGDGGLTGSWRSVEYYDTTRLAHSVN
jgi:hypothetical protein